MPKKPKAPAKRKRIIQPCNCPFNAQISNVYTEAFKAKMGDAEDDECTAALLHNEEFNYMADALEDNECDPRLVLVDAARFGIECGRRLTEIRNLEKLVGY